MSDNGSVSSKSTCRTLIKEVIWLHGHSMQPYYCQMRWLRHTDQKIAVQGSQQACRQGGKISESDRGEVLTVAISNIIDDHGVQYVPHRTAILGQWLGQKGLSTRNIPCGVPAESLQVLPLPVQRTLLLVAMVIEQNVCRGS